MSLILKKMNLKKASETSIFSYSVSYNCGTPLYSIPPSDQSYTSRLSVEQHLLVVCAYASNYNISTQQFQDLVLMLNLHLPENNLCGLDVQKIKRQCGYDSDKTTIHEYCSKCGALTIVRSVKRQIVGIYLMTQKVMAHFLCLEI